MALKSHRSKSFNKAFDQLPSDIQKLAEKNFALWKSNHSHPSLDFKELENSRWSVRVGYHYRAMGIRDDDTIIWYWIGTHEEYNHLF